MERAPAAVLFHVCIIAERAGGRINEVLRFCEKSVNFLFAGMAAHAEFHNSLPYDKTTGRSRAKSIPQAKEPGFYQYTAKGKKINSLGKNLEERAFYKIFDRKRKIRLFMSKKMW